MNLSCQGFSRSITCMLIVLTLKMFPLLVSSLEMSGCFFLYCLVVLVGLPLAMLIMPETKDKSLSQINQIFVQEEKVKE